MPSMQPAQRTLMYLVPPGESYIDLAAGLSAVNRRAYRQGMQFAVSKIEFAFTGKPGSADSVALSAYTAGSTWVVHNAWKKAQAHWLAQQRRTRKLLGESAKPKYEDFKVYLDDAHRAGTSLAVVASDGAVVGAGEWDYSTFVWEADDNSIDEPYLHLIGGDVSTTDWGLILGYQESRATVQPEDPSLPTDYSVSMYAKLGADQDLVADEVGNNMESQNDEPPYDQDDYPGNDSNADRPWAQETQFASAGYPNATLDGFIAECGLILLNNQGYAANGDEASAPVLTALVTLVPGKYKGVAAVPMGQ